MSLIYQISKIFEHILKSRLTNFFNSNNILLDSQFGFKIFWYHIKSNIIH